jgi:hypothetical protein
VLTHRTFNHPTAATTTVHQACIEALEAHSAAVTNSKAQQVVDESFSTTNIASATAANGRIGTGGISSTEQHGSPEARVNVQTGRLELLRPADRAS